MKVAICQMDIIWENKRENYMKAADYIRSAAKQGVDIILFPEMSFTGFSMNISITKEKKYETVHFMKKESLKNKISIGFGWVKENGTKAENHYTIIDYDGNILLDYIKIHPFRYALEHEKFISGDSISTCLINGYRISTFICYDLRFPEIFQSVSNEVSAIIIPANWPKNRSEHWKCLLRARAIENQVYILGVNCVGEKNDIDYSGDSCIINPLGKIVEMLSNKEGLIIKDIEDDVSIIRNEFPIKMDRKVEFYKKIL